MRPIIGLRRLLRSIAVNRVIGVGSLNKAAFQFV
jgi:hypothetical protein